MSVYVIASLTIKDAVRFEDYKRMLLPTMAKYARRLHCSRGRVTAQFGFRLQPIIHSMAVCFSALHVKFVSALPNCSS
jgi:uncharacterized protein (DUF1330 family)